MTKNSKDILIALVCLVLSVFFLVVIVPAQIPLPRFSGGGTTPRAIPRVCCGLILAMSLLMLARAYSGDRNCFGIFIREMGQALRQNHLRRMLPVILVYGLSVLYYLGYSTVGFIPATLAIFPCYAYLLGGRRVFAILATDVVLTFVVYYFFAIFMKCYLPGWAPF